MEGRQRDKNGRKRSGCKKEVGKNINNKIIITIRTKRRKSKIRKTTTIITIT